MSIIIDDPRAEINENLYVAWRMIGDMRVAMEAVTMYMAESMNGESESLLDFLASRGYVESSVPDTCTDAGKEDEYAGKWTEIMTKIDRLIHFYFNVDRAEFSRMRG